MQGAREAPVGKEQQLARLRLCDAARSTLWCFGDWWAYGEHRYGDRKALVESEDWFGPTFQTCADAAWVCQKFETSRRREVCRSTITVRSPRCRAEPPIGCSLGARIVGWLEGELHAQSEAAE